MPPGEPSDGQDNREPDLAGNRHVQGPGGIRPRVEPPERAQDGQPVRHGPAAAVPPPRGTARRTAPRGTPPRGRSEQPIASRRPSFPEQLSPRGILPLAGLQRQQRGDQNDHARQNPFPFHRSPSLHLPSGISRMDFPLTSMTDFTFPSLSKKHIGPANVVSLVRTALLTSPFA